jgi:non-ribosomal peptide synthetase component F
MNTRFASPSPAADAAPAPSLDDLFVPRRDATDERLAATLTLEADFAQRWLASLDTTGFLPDTLFDGAWRLLRSRWLGAEPDGTADTWLAELDGQRRSAACDSESDNAIRLSLDARPGYPARLQLDAAPNLMDAAAADRLLAAIADTAADLLARPDAALCSIRTQPDADRRDQLDAWNTPPGAIDRAFTVPAMFSRQAAATPDAVALVEGDEAMRYGELERRSDRFAQHLRQSGVRPGDNVGMMFERSMDAVVAMLGILKAGAAYVPVPADFPAERVANMLGRRAPRTW